MFLGFVANESLELIQTDTRAELDQKERQEKAQGRGRAIKTAADMIMQVLDRQATMEYQRIMMDEMRAQRENEKKNFESEKKAKKSEKEIDDDTLGIGVNLSEAEMMGDILDDDLEL